MEIKVQIKNLQNAIKRLVFEKEDCQETIQKIQKNILHIDNTIDRHNTAIKELKEQVQ